jgi:isoleucyl-tRNA synthetase
MAKRFAEYKGLNLTETNNQVRRQWEENDIFHKSIT